MIVDIGWGANEFYLSIDRAVNFSFVSGSGVIEQLDNDYAYLYKCKFPNTGFNQIVVNDALSNQEIGSISADVNNKVLTYAHNSWNFEIQPSKTGIKTGQFIL